MGGLQAISWINNTVSAYWHEGLRCNLCGGLSQSALQLHLQPFMMKRGTPSAALLLLLRVRCSCRLTSGKQQQQQQHQLMQARKQHQAPPAQRTHHHWNLPWMQRQQRWKQLAVELVLALASPLALLSHLLLLLLSQQTLFP